MEKPELGRASFQPGLVVLLVAVPFVGGAIIFAWSLFETLGCMSAAGDCQLGAPMSVFFSVLGLALMFLPGLAALVFALYESPGRNRPEQWGGLR